MRGSFKSKVAAPLCQFRSKVSSELASRNQVFFEQTPLKVLISSRLRWNDHRMGNDHPRYMKAGLDLGSAVIALGVMGAVGLMSGQMFGSSSSSSSLEDEDNYHKSRVSDEWLNENIPGLDTAEVDHLGNPMFIRKLHDFNKSHDEWDEMHAKYLYKHRTLIPANAKAKLKSASEKEFYGNAIHYCAKFKILSHMLKWLLNDGAINPNEPSMEKMKNTPLIYAVINDNFKGVRLLLNDPRVDRELTNAWGYSPFLAALHHSSIDMVSLLAKEGCCVDCLFEVKSADDHTVKQNAMQCCVSKSRLNHMLDWLLKEGSIDPNQETDDEHSLNCLQIAAANGNIEAVERLLEDPRVDINGRNSHGGTVLMYAALFNQADLVTYLLQHGSDPTLRNDDGRTALDCALVFDALPCAEILQSV